MEILTRKPNYAEFLIDEGKRDHIDMGKCRDRARYKDAGGNCGWRNWMCGMEEEREDHARRRGGIWILDNSQGISRGQSFLGTLPMGNLRVIGR